MGVEVPGHVMPVVTAERRPVPRAAGAVGEHCVVLSAEPPWKRSLTVFSRVPPTGAATDFLELPYRSWPYAQAPASPVRAHEDCAGEPAVVR